MKRFVLFMLRAALFLYAALAVALVALLILIIF